MEPSTVFERLRAILVQVAQARKTVSDRDLMARLGWNDHGPNRAQFLAFLLRSIGYIQHRAGSVPLLPAIVVSEETGRPARSFFELARSCDRLTAVEDEDAFWLRELARVYRFWSGEPSR